MADKAGGADKAFMAVLAALFLAALASPMAGARFPVNDDWTQAVAVRETLETGQLFYPAWLSAYSYVQIAYGVALSALFGFSYPLLRATTIILAVGSASAAFLFARRRGFGRTASASVAALLVVNPVFLFLAFTFQTDVPALFFLSLAFLIYEIGFGSGSVGILSLGSLAAAAAFLTRQVGIIALVTGAAVAWREKSLRLKGLTVAFALPAAFAVSAALLAWRFGLVQGEGGTHTLPFDRALPAALVTNAWHCFMLLALFVLPVSVSVSVGNPSWFRRKAFLISLALASVAASLAVFGGESIGSLGNILTPYGFGPTVSVLQGELEPVFPPGLLAAVTGLLSLGGAVWIYAFVESRSARDDWRRGAAALLSFGAAYLAVILFTHPFDRYLLPLFPLAAYASAIVLERSSHSKAAFVATAAALLAFSIVGVGDAFAWRAALWRLGERVEASGVPTGTIEGGYEWDGDRLYAEATRRPLGVMTPAWAPWYVRDLFPGHGMEVILSFSPLGGYGIMDMEEAGGVFGDRTIYANLIRPGSLQRDGGGE